jgi:holliday junction DNA helicase RuvA
VISYFRGIVSQILGQKVVIDVSGIGYELFATKKLLSEIKLGEERQITIHSDQREDGVTFYGFFDNLEKQAFLLLLKVKGIGCRTANEIISQSSVRELLKAIASGEVRQLQGVKGIGKKTAERIIVELRDIVGESALEFSGGSVSADSIEITKGFDISKLTDGNDNRESLHDAYLALCALGFAAKDAERALTQIKLSSLKQVPGGDLTPEIVREALKYV